jgi:carboxypeptidase family protein
VQRRSGVMCFRFPHAAIVFAVYVLFAVASFAQLPTAKIVGTVKDTSGASVPGATVKVTNVDTNVTRTVMTEADGSYNVPELATGNYQVEVTASGFKAALRRGITLEVADAPVINFTVEVGATEQQVVVSSEIPIVNTQDATLGGSVNEQRMSDLPLNGRNYVDLGLLQPGVSRDIQHGSAGGAVGTSFSANGAPVRSNNFTLDGAPLQTLNGRNPASLDGTTLGVDGIKEFKIITSDFPAEYGLTMGSQMVMVSKNGTNQFHGDFFDYFRNSVLDARNFFDGPKVPGFQRNQFGGSAGGPIKKDKTFFYGVYEGIRQHLGVTNNLTVPPQNCLGPAGALITPAQCPLLSGPVTVSSFIAPILTLIPPVPAGQNGLGSYGFGSTSHQSENYGQMRVDQNFSSADTFFARYTIDNAIFNNATTGVAAVAVGTNYPYWGLQGTTRNQYITLSENHVFSPTVLNTARISFSRTDWGALDTEQGLTPAQLAAGTMVSSLPQCSTPVGCFGQFSIGGINGGSFATIGPAEDNPQNKGLQNIYTLSDDVNWTRGKHSFKFGFLGNRWNLASTTSHSLQGFNTYASLDDFLTSSPQIVELAVGQPSNLSRFTIFSTLGFYGQDDWRVTQRLTVNVGLRYEFMTTPHELDGRQSHVLNDYTDPFTIGPIMKNNTLHDFSPRLGMAYDLFGNGKTALRAGFGMYFDNGNIGSTLQNDVIGSPPFSGLIDIVSNNPSPVSLPLPASITGIPTTSPLVTPQFVDYDAKSPYMIQWNASVEQQLPWNMGVSVAYVGNHGVHLWTIRESNPIFPTSFGPCGDPASLCVSGSVPFWDATSPNYQFVNPNMSSTINLATVAESQYQALQVVLNKRVNHGLQFQLAYTRSRVYDDTQGQANVSDCTVSTGLQGVYPENPRAADWGPSCFNIPNNFEGNAIYYLPTTSKGSSLVQKAVNGWWMTSIVAVETGEPFSLVTGFQRSQSGVLQGQGDRVDLNTPALLAAYPCTSLPGQPRAGNNPCPNFIPIPFDPNTVITHNLNQWFNPAMFSLAPDCTGPGLTNCSGNIGQLGNSPRNFLTNSPLRNWDYSIVKDTKVGFLGEGGMIQFRTEVFNILNHPFFGPASGLLAGGGASPSCSKGCTPFDFKPSATAGLIKTAPGTPRQIQFALKVVF